MEGQLKDSELRGLANEQNLRRRHQQEIADTHKFAGQKFAAEMLPVKDYLEMALLDQSGNFDALKMGVQMTLNELQKAFDATHIKEINPQPGDKLDPHQHQAMQAVVSEQEPNTIVSVMKKRLYIGRSRPASCDGCCGEKRRLKAPLDKVYQA